jgi:putative spermidine/putrescine transport system ATP-binding protein
MTQVRLDRITKHFGNTAAVEALSLTVEPGEFVVLLGPSGCGKTTTLRMIAGFVEASAGTIFLGRRDITREPPHRRNIGFVFQNYALFPHLNVRENVAFGLRRRNVRAAELERRVDRAIELVKLDGLGDRMPRQLSGGQQQRVALARALVIEPDVLLLDEPLSNLDARLRHDVRGELRRLQKLSALTTIMVTHDQDEAMSVGDRLAVMNAGRVQQVGTAQSLYRQPANRFVASFIGRGNFIAGRPAADRKSFITRSGLTIACDRVQADDDTLLVRPEDVSVERGQVSGTNCFAATIEAATFLGASFELDLRLAGGEKLLAEVSGSRAAPPADWLGGEAVTVRLDAAAAIGLRGSAEPTVEVEPAGSAAIEGANR